MTYFERIEALKERISKDIIDFSIGRKKSNTPNQATSDFMFNREQGDWAEKTLAKCINENSDKYIVVHYGKSDDIIAGEDGFKEFYESYQEELDKIGKRPDLLIFSKEDFDCETNDISNYPLEELEEIVPKAKCGIEVRSSLYLYDEHNNQTSLIHKELVEKTIETKNKILDSYSDLLKTKDSILYDNITKINEDNLQIPSFRVPFVRNRNEEQETLCKLLKDLRTYINKIAERDFISITPKVEDIKVVYKWIETYNVPHFYVQLFFDKAYGMSFESILESLSRPEAKNKEYFIEGDEKNQYKRTIKFNPTDGKNILEKIDIPRHHSEMKELKKGKLLFYVKFEDSNAIINKEEFERLFGFELE